MLKGGLINVRNVISQSLPKIYWQGGRQHYFYYFRDSEFLLQKLKTIRG